MISAEMYRKAQQILVEQHKRDLETLTWLAELTEPAPAVPMPATPPRRLPGPTGKPKPKAKKPVRVSAVVTSRGGKLLVTKAVVAQAVAACDPTHVTAAAVEAWLLQHGYKPDRDNLTGSLRDMAARGVLVAHRPGHFITHYSMPSGSAINAEMADQIL